MQAPANSFGSIMSGRGTRVGRALRREGVKRSAEFLRIAALPRRSLAGSVDVDALTLALRTASGAMRLREDQAYALKEIGEIGGAFIGMLVGAGKSLITLLGPTVVGAKRPLLLVPAAARDQTLNDVIPKMRAHWRVAPNLMVGSHESLSTTNGANFLRDRMPDWIFVDEAHKFKDLDSARTIRLARHLESYPNTRIVVLSGSFFDSSLKDFAHLMRWALRDLCPVPMDRDDLEAWSLAVDSRVRDEDRMAPGALSDFCDGAVDLDAVRRGVGERIRQTPGVIFSTRRDLKIPLHIRETRIVVPAAVRDAFSVLRSTWETPRGDEITDAIHLYRSVRQLAQGFFYRWVWPKDPITGKETPDLIWLDARKNWHRFVRRTIFYSRALQLDSYKMVWDACERFERLELAKLYKQQDVIDKLRDHVNLDSTQYRSWLAVKDRYVPVKEVVWIDKYLVNFAAEWLDDSTGLAWIESEAMGNAIRQKGFRYYRGGEDEIIHETVSCAAAVKAHSFAKNLQHFSRNLILTPPTKGTEWEQLLGRTYRSGQKAPIVSVDVLLLARELWGGFFNARSDARYAQSAGSDQLLCASQTTLDLQTDESDLLRRVTSGDPLWSFSGV